MDALALLVELESRGVEVWVEGNRLRFQPAEQVTPDLLAELRRCKASLLVLIEDPLPPPGDPRRLPSVLIAAAQTQGARLVLEDDRIRVAPAARASRELTALVEKHQGDLIRYYAAELTPRLAEQPALPGMKPRALP